MPKRCANRGDTTEATAIEIATGIVRTPASSGLYPRISWKYWVMRNTKPNSAKNAAVIDTLAAVKRRLRKIRTGSIGCGTRNSQATNTAISTALAAKPASVLPSSQPNSGASMIVKTSAPMAAIERRMPPRSRRGDSVSRDSGTTRTVAVIATAAIGRLM